MAKDFEFIEHTADLKFISYGNTLDDCLKNSAKAVFAATLDLDSIFPATKKKISIRAESLESLVHDFLSELIFLFSARKMVFGKFDVNTKKENGDYILNAFAYGEKLNLKKHKIEKEVKAVTYHDMKIEKTDSGWSIQVVCDV